jgi:serine/threonine protein phosphatase 1
MRTLAIGDIHGCLKAFDTLLAMIELQPDDVLVTLGDYVDRGPDSNGVLDRLLDLRSYCKVVPLKGNHELIMLQACQDRVSFNACGSCGGRATLDSYGAALEYETFVSRIPRPHWRFLTKECVAYHETERHFFVHANACADLPFDQQPDYMIYWEHLIESRSVPHESGKIMVCGHTQQRSGRPLVLEHAICIDTWAYGDGWLTCLDVEKEAYWQANQRGETRRGLLGFRG